MQRISSFTIKSLLGSLGIFQEEKSTNGCATFSPLRPTSLITQDVGWAGVEGGERGSHLKTLFSLLTVAMVTTAPTDSAGGRLGMMATGPKGLEPHKNWFYMQMPLIIEKKRMETIIKPITYGQICSDVSDIIQFQSEGVLGIPFARTFVRSSMNIAVLLVCPLASHASAHTLVVSMGSHTLNEPTRCLKIIF